MTEQVLKSSPDIRWRTIALPVEHGGWGFLIEPILLGLLVAFSPAALALSLSAVGVFLIHQPLKTALKDRLNGRRYLRTRWAERFALGYGLVSLLGFILALLTSSFSFWLPLLLAVPFAVIQLAYEARGRGRELLPEIGGALALGATAPAIWMASSGTFVTGLLLWLLLALRIVPSLLYVRVVLRQVRGKPASAFPPLAAHLVAGFIMVLLWLAEWINGFALLAIVVLFLRAAYRLSRKQPVPAKVIGIQEMVFGLCYVLLLALSLEI
jgi:4-hydroxybenzoate polyprenyltransferase